MAMRATRYAKSGDVHVAYQVFGSGPIDLVLAPGFVSQIENYWDQPDLARWLLRLGSFARVIMFDKRGTGLSDPVSEVPSLDLRMDDVRAVMDAAGIERAAQLGISEGGPLATLFAATYPERCRGLVLYGSFARSSWITPEGLEAYLGYVERAWGSGGSLPMWAPSRKSDPALQQWWGRFERLGIGRPTLAKSARRASHDGAAATGALSRQRSEIAGGWVSCHLRRSGACRALRLRHCRGG
jgi:pimeloyl-ACP methyl ester carboxylesterase